MLGHVFKPFLPRGLYWRAALIVFVPFVTILLVVSLAFVQRHYTGVTRQMTGNFLLVANHVMAQIDAAPDQASADTVTQALATAFDLGIVLDAPVPLSPGRPPFYDLSGKVAIDMLRAELPQQRGLSVQRGAMSLWLDGRHGLVRLDFEQSRISASNPHQLIIWMLVVGVVMSLISFVFLKNQMRPMRRLALAAEAFGRGQSVPLRVSGATEVRQAQRAFLDMRERIERHIEQRTLMLSGVSHDLRTPLTRMRLGLSMMDDEAEAAALLTDVREMEALIDRFLEFARSEAAEPMQSVDLRALAAQRVAEAARGGARVHFLDADGPEAHVVLRPQMFARALDNLLGNAVRYGARAEVWIEGDASSLSVVVEDDGPGIAPSDFDRATRPFVRLDPARGASKGSGVGLGLAIVADAMRGQGGRLVLETGSAPGLGGLRARLALTKHAGQDPTDSGSKS